MDVWNANALIGARLGSSTLERPLGIGGMGAVYLARQERPRRHVAVKVLRPGLAANEDAWQIFLARFRREADAAAALDHANIVPIYEFGEQGSMAYIVMPYLADGSLANFLLPDARLSVDDVIAYIDQAASALDYAHQHSIIHRDVKPSNLLLHPDGRVLLGDFGIARPLNMADLPMAEFAFEGGDLTVSGAAMGTPEYMAPEQVRGETVSAATDTYALGVVTYTLLTGHTPFEGHDINQVLASQLDKMPPPMRSKRRDVPRDVEDAVMWALAKDPSHRPGSTGAFARALHAASTGVPMATMTTGSVPVSRANLRALSASHNAPGSGVGVLASQTNAGVSRMSRMSQDGPDSPTLYEGAYRGGRGGFGAPAWPSAPSGDGPQPPIRARTLGLVALLSAAGVLALTLAVVLASGSLQNLFNFNQNNTGGILAHTTATAWPTATVKPSPTPVANWLQVSPATIQFGCHKNERSFRVELTNLGPEQVDWQATKSDAWRNFQISLSSSHGTLDQGESKTLTVSYSSGWVELNGTFTFTADDHQAGDPAVLTFNAPSCFNRNSAPQNLTPVHAVKHADKPTKPTAKLKL